MTRPPRLIHTFLFTRMPYVASSPRRSRTSLTGGDHSTRRLRRYPRLCAGYEERTGEAISACRTASSSPAV